MLSTNTSTGNIRKRILLIGRTKFSKTRRNKRLACLSVLSFKGCENLADVDLNLLAAELLCCFETFDFETNI